MEHWFIFHRYQFSEFYTSLFTLVSFSNNQTNQQEQIYLTFSLSTYDRFINIDISTRNSNETIILQQQSIRLSIERADLVFNTLNHIIFIAIRDRIKLETYVNCKLIDSHLLDSSILINQSNNLHTFYKIQNITENISYIDKKDFCTIINFR